MTEPEAFQRDDEFWIEDGNIVLVASGVGFCVYRGLLAGQSEVFRGMLALPNPVEPEQYNEIPVVRLSDSKEDLRHLLRALLPSQKPLFYRYVPSRDPIPSAMLSAVIRLAHKYGFTELESQGIACLKTFYTHDFDTWQRAKRFETPLPFRLYDFSPIEVIHIARLTDTPTLLPIAFYQCATEGDVIAKLAEGHTREDGTSVKLDADDLLRCLKGQRYFANRGFSTFTYLFDAVPDKHCTKRKDCGDILQSIRAEAEDHMRDYESILCPLELWWHSPYRYYEPQDRWPENELCSCCFSMMKKRDRDEREEIWDDLPGVFSLPEWS
ncbi:hypothetical protein VTO73DRAFT_11923 [Trametes versicolor]